MFKKMPSEEELRGTTVNERLWMCGLDKKWDRALKSRKRERMIAVLLQAKLPQAACEETVDAILMSPDKYDS